MSRKETERQRREGGRQGRGRKEGEREGGRREGGRDLGEDTVGLIHLSQAYLCENELLTHLLILSLVSAMCQEV